MSELTEHCRRLLGLDEAWRVARVDLQPQEKRVEIAVEHVGGRLTCPECGASGPQVDQAERSSWRHLDTMQFETRITAAVPRCGCPAYCRDPFRTGLDPFLRCRSRISRLGLLNSAVAELADEAFADDILLSVGTSIFVDVVYGFNPAWKASRKGSIQTLRYNRHRYSVIVQFNHRLSKGNRQEGGFGSQHVAKCS